MVENASVASVFPAHIPPGRMMLKALWSPRHAFALMGREGLCRSLWRRWHGTQPVGEKRIEWLLQPGEGLYGYHWLHEPCDFLHATNVAVEEAHAQLASMLDRNVPSDIYGLDAMSLALCTVADAASATIVLHSDVEWKKAAREARECVGQCMEQLNTCVPLYHRIRRCVASKAFESMTEEQREVLLSLMREMEESGIALPDADRKAYVTLCGEVLALETQFVADSAQDREDVPTMHLTSSDLLHHLPSTVRKMISWEDNGSVHVPLSDFFVSNILRWVPSGALRRDTFLAFHKSRKDIIPVLEGLTHKRMELARLLGYKSYAHYVLTNRRTLMGSPEEAIRFLEGLAEQIRPKANEEFDLLRQAKNHIEGTPDIYPWDMDYYMAMAKTRLSLVSTAEIAPYFSLENCMRGLWFLTSQLFELNLEERPVERNGMWDPHVRKFHLVDPRAGDVLGTLYLDLYARARKFSGCAHYTIMVGTRLTKPVIVLSTTFAPPTATLSEPLLNLHEVETLFHEFGHALHTFLSRTECHHLSGTRAMADFVETPSQLWELFTHEFSVVSQYAQHHITRKSIPASLVEKINNARNVLRHRERLDMIRDAMVDLTLHSAEGPHAVCEVERCVYDKYSLVPHVEGMCKSTGFGHLAQCPALYYAYLLDEVLAQYLWHKRFAGDPLNPTTGRRYWDQVLAYGGSKHPKRILQDFLGEDVDVLRMMDKVQI